MMVDEMNGTLGGWVNYLSVVPSATFVERSIHTLQGDCASGWVDSTKSDGDGGRPQDLSSSRTSTGITVPYV